jgi:branched-chain amino acid transport system ATP-binding protein
VADRYPAQVFVATDPPQRGLRDTPFGTRSVVGDLRSRGLTTVIVDHDIAFIADVCDRLLAMSFGRQLGIGTPTEVLGLPEVRKSYLGLKTKAR